MYNPLLLFPPRALEIQRIENIFTSSLWDYDQASDLFPQKHASFEKQENFYHFIIIYTVSNGLRENNSRKVSNVYVELIDLFKKRKEILVLNYMQWKY